MFKSYIEIHRVSHKNTPYGFFVSIFIITRVIETRFYTVIDSTLAHILTSFRSVTLKFAYFVYIFIICTGNICKWNISHLINSLSSLENHTLWKLPAWLKIIVARNIYISISCVESAPSLVHACMQSITKVLNSLWHWLFQIVWNEFWSSSMVDSLLSSLW